MPKSTRRIVLEIDRYRIQTGEGAASMYVVVERPSGFCWNASAIAEGDVAGAVGIVREAVDKLRAAADKPIAIELCHDGADAFAHELFRRGLHDLGLARVSIAGAPQSVAVAERAFWEMRGFLASSNA